MASLPARFFLLGFLRGKKKSDFNHLGKNLGLQQGGEKPQESSLPRKDGIAS